MERVATSVDLASVVPELVRTVGCVSTVELAGSRARGDSGRFSDWDFVLHTTDHETAVDALPAALRPLESLAAQWDRLSDVPCFMLIVPGPVKIDLIFDGVPHECEPPWDVDATTLVALDAHFWDWSLWLTSKVAAGNHAFVETELDKMHAHLLAPLGVPRPQSLFDAMMHYTDALPEWERRLGVSLDRTLRDAVAPVVRLADVAHVVSSETQLEFLETLVQENASIAGDVVQVREDLWVIHGFVPVDGDVLMAEFDTYDEAASVLDHLSRRTQRRDES